MIPISAFFSFTSVASLWARPRKKNGIPGDVTCDGKT
jgi:hypothetical protein